MTGEELNSNSVVFLLTSAIPLLLALGGGVGAEVIPSPSPQPVDVDPELILTLEEKRAFDKFKAAVLPHITEEWLKQFLAHDLYLLRWIRAKGLDVEFATSEMLNFLEWIRQNRIEKALEEDFADLALDFPVYSTDDRAGRLVVYISLGESFDVRRAVLQGNRERLNRYLYQIVFRVGLILMERVRREGNVTQALVLVDLEGFNVFQHSCPACINIYLTLLGLYERFIPGFVKEIIVVNTPRAFLVLLEVLRPVLSPQTRRSLKLFGTNRRRWGPYLEERIDLENLPWEFGGNGLSYKVNE